MTEASESREIPAFDGRNAVAQARQLVAGFEATSLTAVLHAACSSPTARQAMPSCTALLMSCWASPPAGSRTATAEDLAPLVEALRTASPDLAMVEDFVPLDPRNQVHFRADSEFGFWGFRVHPGGLESPLQTLQAIVNYAEALDPALLLPLGFGVADLLQIAGKMLDAELETLAPTWGSQEVSLESAPAVTEAEVAAAGHYLKKWRSGEEFPAVLAELQDGYDGARLARAAGSVTTDSGHLSFDAGPDLAHVGPSLLIRCPAGVLPVPASLIIESLMAATTAALRFLSTPDEDADKKPSSDELNGEPPGRAPRVPAQDVAAAARRWRERAESDLAWACRAIPASILFGHMDDTGHELLLIASAHRHVLAVELVTGFSPVEISDSIRAARERLAGFGPGSRFRISPSRDHKAKAGRVRDTDEPLPGATDTGLAWLAGTADAIPFAESLMTGETAALAAGTVVTRIVVVDGPWQHAAVWVPEIPACTLDEFRSLLAAQDWQSTDREEMWSFLDELTSLGADSAGNGYAQLACWSILDAWEAWQANGMLCPAWVEPDTCARILPRDLDSLWEYAALLDGVDALLTSLGMSGAREWSQLIPAPVPVALPNSDEMSVAVTLSLYVPRRIWWVAPDMELVINADLEFRDGLVFSRAAVGTLANAVEDTLREVARQSPHAWQLWREAHGNHAVAIQIMPGRVADDVPALRFVGMSEKSDVLYVDPQQLADLPDADIHALIGEALALGMLARLQSIDLLGKPFDNPDEDATGADESSAHGGGSGDDADRSRVIEFDPSDDDIQRAETFKAAWQSIGPRLTQYASTAPFQSYELTSAQTLTENGRKRARRMIARRLRNRFAPGTHPLAAVRTELCPGALDALSAAADAYAPRAALAASCAELERALSDRYTSRTSLELNLSSSWAEETFAEIDVTASSDETLRSRTSELLIERLLSQPPTGSLVPDRRDIHQLLDLASAALEASIEAQDAYAGIRPVELQVSEFGDIDIMPAGSAKADIRAWQQAQLDDQARAFSANRNESSGTTEAQAGLDSGDRGSEETNQRDTLRSILERDIARNSGWQALNASGLLEVDNQLIEHCGFGLDSIVAVLGTVTSWDVPAEPRPPIAEAGRAALVDTAAEMSGLPHEQIDAAVRALTLTADQILQEGLRYWQLRERSARLALRPLITPPGVQGADNLWLLPRCAHRTQHLFLNYLNGQQLPWPGPELPKPVQQAVTAWHKLAEDHLETELATAAESAGIAFRSNLRQNKANLEGLTLRGEIDLIAVDPARRRIWIMEAKHLRQAFSPLEQGFRIADFHGPAALAIGPDSNQFRQFQGRAFTPYVQRVLANARAVSQNNQSAIRLIAAVSPVCYPTQQARDDWEIIPVIVTTYVEISAFVPRPGVTFVLIDHLKELLNVDQCPAPGWWAPWSN